MRFLSPTALWWLLLGAVIISLYLLKLKRKRRIVSSLLLWQRALEEMEANAPFKRLRRSLLLLLQLLALAALVVAFARPLITVRALASGNTVIIIDSTASMRSRDENGSTRLQRAKQIAQEMVDGLSGGDRAAILEASSQVAVRSPLTSDRAALAAAIDGIAETDAAGDLSEAIRLAEQIAKAERETSIAIISDGAGGQEPGAAAPVAAGAAAHANSLRFIRVGERSANVGIVALNSRPAQGGLRQELFAAIANFGDVDRTVGAELRIDGKLVDARSVQVSARGRSGVIFESLPAAGGLAELRLDVDDDLPSDNVAYAFLPDARRLRVGVASDNPFLLQALAANPDLEAHKIAASGAADLASLDCVVTEGAVAASLIDSNKPLLAVNPADAPGFWQTSGQRERPDATTVDHSHPINAYLSFTDLHIETCPRRTAAPWLKPVVSSGADPLIWAGEDGHRRVVMLGFDLAKSDLPLKVEFPLLIANATAWLGGRDAAQSERAVRAGQPVTIHTTAPSIEITTPNGEKAEAPARDGVAVFAGTARAGLYQVKDAPPFAVSLLSESESDNAARDSIKTREGEVSGQAMTFSSEREIWRWIALLVLATLSFEWLVYHRRVGTV